MYILNCFYTSRYCQWGKEIVWSSVPSWSTNSSSQLLIVEIQWKRFSEFYPIVMNNEEISSKLYSNVSGTLFHNKSYIHHKSYFKTVAWNHKQMRSPLLNLILLEILMELEPPPIFPWDFYNSDFFQRKPCHLVGNGMF